VMALVGAISANLYVLKKRGVERASK